MLFEHTGKMAVRFEADFQSDRMNGSPFVSGLQHDHRLIDSPLVQIFRDPDAGYLPENPGQMVFAQMQFFFERIEPEFFTVMQFNKPENLPNNFFFGGS